MELSDDVGSMTIKLNVQHNWRVHRCVGINVSEFCEKEREWEGEILDIHVKLSHTKLQDENEAETEAVASHTSGVACIKWHTFICP